MHFKEFLPPIVAKSLASIRPAKYGWFGDYGSWEDAAAHTSGYDAEAIAQKVLDAALKVKQGKAAYERDSVTFDRPEYPWPILSGILWAAAKQSAGMTVMDFGGSLGSTYFTLRAFLQELTIRWHVVEQPRFVELGRVHFQDERLKFFLTPESCVAEGAVDVILLSSVLPYLREPYATLGELVKLRAPFLIVDKMPFLVEGDKDRLTIQRVDPAIYPASYPAWFFNEARFRDFMSKNFETVAEFPNEDRANLPSVFKGFLFKRKTN
ncbi:MAG: methyltransferase, TIGR04325 family [Cyclobacteriaceae bacterium]|nr:methyltransferase, TIGR04325 family [Cyclobacteriaceae bacterium]